MRLAPIIADARRSARVLRLFAAVALLAACHFSSVSRAVAQTSFENYPGVGVFVAELADNHGFDRERLARLFRQGRIQHGVLQAMARPATARPWHEFRNATVTAARIREGGEYWRRNARALARASAQYGVPEEIIVATIGIETAYGRMLGGGRVFDALATLAFAYPPRAALFRGELTELLLLARETGTHPLHYKGSFAGALGVPQFLPSSYRRHAVDFDADGRRDLWNHADAIGSIGNYYRAHGWAAGEPVLMALERTHEPPGDAFRQLLERGILPHSSVATFRSAGVTLAGIADDEALACAFAAETDTGTAYWLGFRNFYVITRYNRSINYALAVHELAHELRRLRDSQAN
jgi:membrane-bound lytic murein transglycosylase B